MSQANALNSSKLNAYGVLEGTSVQVSKANTYGILQGTAEQVSKLNVYAILLDTSVFTPPGHGSGGGKGGGRPGGGRNKAYTSSGSTLGRPGLVCRRRAVRMRIAPLLSTGSSVLLTGVAATKANSRFSGAFAVTLVARGNALVTERTSVVGAVGVVGAAKIVNSNTASSSGKVGVSARMASLTRVAPGLGTAQIAALLARLFSGVTSRGATTGSAAVTARGQTTAALKSSPTGKVPLGATTTTTTRGMNTVSSLFLLAGRIGSAVRAASRTVSTVGLTARVATSATPKGLPRFPAFLGGTVKSFSTAKVGVQGALRLSAKATTRAAMRLSGPSGVSLAARALVRAGSRLVLKGSLTLTAHAQTKTSAQVRPNIGRILLGHISTFFRGWLGAKPKSVDATVVVSIYNSSECLGVFDVQADASTFDWVCDKADFYWATGTIQLVEID